MLKTEFILTCCVMRLHPRRLIKVMPVWFSSLATYYVTQRVSYLFANKSLSWITSFLILLVFQRLRLIYGYTQTWNQILVDWVNLFSCHRSVRWQDYWKLYLYFVFRKQLEKELSCWVGKPFLFIIGLNDCQKNHELIVFCHAIYNVKHW